MERKLQFFVNVYENFSDNSLFVNYFSITLQPKKQMSNE